MMYQLQFSILTGIKDGSTSNIFGAIGIIALFVVILFGAYFTTKFVANHQTSRLKNNHIKIIEAIQVGPGKTVQLIKAGEDFLLIGVTKDHITSLKSISKDEIDLTIQENQGKSIPFSQYLSAFKNKKNKGNE
ncbi:MAG: flagellar biosynthetic protein FliO [Vallitaleaceae bacterium]|jgi:flagellar protein FliO/FliZ|nr:flagellar biosynthetic protein FliO [Vallitaleaceae bacterium]